jgi:hypothetical protein
MKVLIHRIWELGLGWDDQVLEHILEKWKVWRSELPVLSNIHLQRYLYLEEKRSITTASAMLLGSAPNKGQN